MTAGTVVITGGILATVILLCIIAVLCYCRLQYYCCKKNGSDSGSLSQQHFACNACSVSGPGLGLGLGLGLDGSALTPLSLSPPAGDPADPPAGRRRYCPTCSPYDSPFYVRGAEEMRNGGERVGFMPTHYDNQALAPPLPTAPGSLLRDSRRTPQHDFYTNTRAISTEV
ncbi:protein FAM163A-like [Centroberyx affinis]|uniref:protein FAM163A-like n=1 Tax=Centroberyx affinis TaxID=166261 RepID=UPI003A5C691E